MVKNAAGSTDNHDECPAHKRLCIRLVMTGRVRVIASLSYSFCAIVKRRGNLSATLRILQITTANARYKKAIHSPRYDGQRSEPGR